MPTETNGEGIANHRKECPVEQTPLSGGNEDVEVNITGCINYGKAIEEASEDLTEYSSSFGDTGSDVESGSVFSDTEVESQMCDDNASLPMCDDRSEPHRIRKRKMTTHWRRFAGPLVWRCKWLELKLNILNSQQLKYDKELTAYNYKKQREFSKYTEDGFDVKSVPISNGNCRNKVMKRKKRKKGEEFDVSSYMSSHNIFSYYEKKDSANGACLEDFRGVATRGNADDNEDLGLNVGGLSVDHEDNDKFLDDIIRKIEAIQSHVQKLKTQVDKVVSENRGKFRSATHSSNIGPNDLLLPGNDLVEEAEELVERSKSISLVQISEPGLADENAPNNAHPKACSTSKPKYPRNTRRRRKSARKSWRKR